MNDVPNSAVGSFVVRPECGSIPINHARAVADPSFTGVGRESTAPAPTTVSQSIERIGRIRGSYVNPPDLAESPLRINNRHRCC